MSTDAPLKERFRIPRWLNLLVVLLIAGFLIRTLVTGWEQIRDFDWRVNVLRIGITLIILLLYFAGQAVIWSWSVRRLGTRISYRIGLEIYITSQLAKYIPGGIWSFANVALSARQAGLSSSITLFMFVVNMVLIVWAAGLCALPVIPTLLPGFPIPIGLLFIAALVVSLVWGPFGLRWALRLLVRWRNLPDDVNITQLASYRRVTFLLTTALLLHVLNCLSFYFFLSAMTEIPRGDEVFVASAWSAAWFMGFIILIVPSGLGVREVSLTVLLGAIMSPPVATAISLGHRVLLTAVDLLLLLLLTLSFAFKQTATHPQHFQEQPERNQ